MGKSVFGPHRREWIVFLVKFGFARLGCLTKGFWCSKKVYFREKICKIGRGVNVFGPHRRERIAVLVELCEPPELSPELNRTGGRSPCKGLNM